MAYWEQFNDPIDPQIWATTGSVTVTGGAAVLGTGATLSTPDPFAFGDVRVELTVPDNAIVSLTLWEWHENTDTLGPEYLRWTVDRDPAHFSSDTVLMKMHDDPIEYGSGYMPAPEVHRWLGFKGSHDGNDYLTHDEDGLDSPENAELVGGVGVPHMEIAKLVITMIAGSGVEVGTIKLIGPGETDPEVDDFEPEPPTTPTVVDNFSPGASWPANPIKTEGQPPVPVAECATLLELIRAFSGKVRRAVRIVGPTTIEMVDPNEPLPTGWTVDDADCAYHSQNQSLTAGPIVLSLLKGKLALDVDASLISNDVRLPVSDWRIPQRLPLYNGLDPAPVKRVSYSFTPRGFSGSVEFHVRDVPLTLRRIN